jgi:hypothetical protein
VTTFAGWLSEQRKREDAVGWFARYWRDLPETPRLSSPASIASHLEDRTTKPGQNKAGERLPYGFTDPEGGVHVRDAYDQTLHEYRAVRAQIVQSAAQEDGLPAGAPEPPAGPQSAAGVAVAAATAAAQEAAARHPVTSGMIAPSQVTITHGSAALGTSEALLAAIYRKLSRIERAMGLESDEDGGQIPVELPWGAWYAQADLAAVPD